MWLVCRFQLLLMLIERFLQVEARHLLMLLLRLMVRDGRCSRVMLMVKLELKVERRCWWLY
jgi:hypothetical protein